MKIKAYLSQHGNDFTATLVCEHCGHEGELRYGYHDGFFHTRVIPAIQCGDCGKDRAGNTEHTDPDVSPMRV